MVQNAAAGEAALTWAEAAWVRYTAAVPGKFLHLHNMAVSFVVYTLAPLPLALLELWSRAAAKPYKLQPRVWHPPATFLRCYLDAVRGSLLLIGPYHFVSSPAAKMMDIRTGLPLPSVGEAAAQLTVYFLVEDYLNYWLHRLLHMRWFYDKIHRVHHEFTAPMAYSALHGHWAENLILAVPSLAGPALAPCHVTTFWLWFAIRLLEAIHIHSGFNFRLNAGRFIPFYGGSEHHDYHHYLGGRSQSNFAPVFTYCDYIYGTDKGYRYYKKKLAKMEQLKEMAEDGNVEKAESNGFVEKADGNGFDSGKQD